MASNASALLALRRATAAGRRKKKDADVPAVPTGGLGRFVIAWIGLLLAYHVWDIYVSWATIQDFANHPDPRWSQGRYWALPTGIFLDALSMLGLCLVLLRRKVGLFLLLLTTLTSVMLVSASGTSGRMMLPAVIGFTVLVIALIPRWRRLR